MKKNNIKHTLLISFFSITVLFGNTLSAQENQQEGIVSSMKTKRENFIKTFRDNEHLLKTRVTENMLTDDQCWDWADTKQILQKEFTKIEDCAGDSLFDAFYKSGLIVQGGLGDELYFVGKFYTKNKLLYSGMTKTQVAKLIGLPYKENRMIMVYKKELLPETAELIGSKFDESVVLIFENNKLIAIWVKFFMMC